MSLTLRKLFSHPALALGSTLLWGLVEVVALFRSRRIGPTRDVADEHTGWG